MKKLFRALSLCLTLALCVFCSTAALAEAPAATPAPQDERVITDVSPLEDQIRNIVGFTESMWNAVCADTLSAGQPYTPENLRNDILAKYGDLAAYNPQVPYDYIVYYGTSLTPSKEFA